MIRLYIVFSGKIIYDHNLIEAILGKLLFFCCYDDKPIRRNILKSNYDISVKNTSMIFIKKFNILWTKKRQNLNIQVTYADAYQKKSVEV